MTRVTVRDLRADAGRCIKSAQHEAVVVTQQGRPAALLIGVAGHDWEAIERQTDPAFWQMLGERRRQATVPLFASLNAGEGAHGGRNVRADTTSETSAHLLKRLGGLFARYRERNRMSLKAVSERVASETYYGMIERGQRRPSPNTLVQLFDVLGMPDEDRREAQRLVEDSILAANRERARVRAHRAGLVAESQARYGEAPESVRGGADTVDRLGRLEDQLRQIHDMLAGLGGGPANARRRPRSSPI